MVVTLKVVKVVSVDNEKVVNLTTQIWYHVVWLSMWSPEVVTVTTFVDNLSSGGWQNRHCPHDNPDNPIDVNG